MTARIYPSSRRRNVSAGPKITSIATIQTIHPGSAKPVATAWSPSANYLAVATQNGSVYIYYILSSSYTPIRTNPIRTYRAHTADVLQMTFSRTDFLLTASMDRTVRLFHPDTNVCLRRFTHPDMVTAVQFHPRDHDFIITGGCDGIARIWRLTDHSCLAQTDVSAVVTSAEFTPDGSTAFVGTYDGRIQLLRLTQFMPDRVHRPGAVSATPPVSPNLNVLHTNTSFQDPIRDAPFLSVWKTIDTNYHRRRRRRQGVKVQGLCLAPGRKEIIATSGDAQVCMYKPDGEILSRSRASLKSDTLPLNSSISPDGQYIVHDAVGGMVRLIHLQNTRKESKRKERSSQLNVECLSVLVDANVSCASFAPASVLENVKVGDKADPKMMLAVGADDGTLRIVEAYYG